MPEDAFMISASSRSANAIPLARVRQLCLALLLLTVPACGLSDYEKLMRQAQERKERFDDEEKYLGEPVKMPTQKDKNDRDKPVANVFFRPPKGIEVKPQSQPRGGLNVWRYARGKGKNDFAFVELVFANDDKDFAANVSSSYATGDQTVRSKRSFEPPERERPLMFECWDSNSGQTGYSVNILLTNQKPLAIIYNYYIKAGTKKADTENVRKAIELSLESLAIDKEANAAREIYSHRSPWRLETQPSEDSESEP